MTFETSYQDLFVYYVYCDCHTVEILFLRWPLSYFVAEFGG
jgi:hypothetical protein